MSLRWLFLLIRERLKAINGFLRVICARLHAYDSASDILWLLGRKMPALLFSTIVSNVYTEVMTSL